MQTNLSVNINKIALIRNSRGSNLPNLVKVALDCESYGADGITVHPRPDQRHVRYDDIPLLKNAVQTEFNIEGYPNKEFIKLVLDNIPHQVTLVPDPPGVLTSNEGWNFDKDGKFLIDILKIFQNEGIRVSLFVEPNPESVKSAKEVKADRVELYTGHYANDFDLEHENNQSVVENYRLASLKAKELNIGLNAGHDLNLDNLKFFKQNTVDLAEVSIGHALVSDALYYGLKNTILMYKNLLK
jgi:pyridoxine 5-phosphate synthase